MTKPTIVFYDVETTQSSAYPHVFRASPHIPTNRVVYYGRATLDALGRLFLLKHCENDCFGRLAGRFVDTYVGVNLSFDLGYAYVAQHKRFKEWYNDGGTIWDCQIAEYLLTAQQSTYPRLNDMSVKYGGEVKDDVVSEMFRAGLGADEIDPDVIKPYLDGDLKNTAIVYEAQYKSVQEKGLLPLVQAMNEARLATIIMEGNGLCVNTEYLKTLKEQTSEDICDLEARVQCHPMVMSFRTAIPGAQEFNPYSSQHLSKVLFGGGLKYSVKVPDGFYKNGNPKFKTETVSEFFGGYGVDPKTVKAKPTALGHSTDDAVLKNVLSYGTPECVKLVEDILSLRRLKKIRDTYCTNLLNQCILGYVYPSFNHCVTKTGRQSSSNPNLQNQTDEGGVKDAFISRFAEGVLVEFDYDQLEMVALALLSNDSQLIEDITNGVDMHSALYFEMFGRYPSKTERKKFKRLTFGLVYGAGAKTLADNSGVPLADAKKFVKTFYNRYSGVFKWHQGLTDEAKKGRIVTSKHDAATGRPIGVFPLVSPTGRVYLFQEWWSDWAGDMAFSPTELKNWRVQGLATGDIVPVMVGRAVRYALKNFIGALPICTVHDSILFDVDTSRVDLTKFIKEMKEVLQNVGAVMAELFGLDCKGLPFKVGCKVGLNWGTMEDA